jgi:hypothetical protein
MAFFGQLAFGVGINASPMDKGLAEVRKKLALIEEAAKNAGGEGGAGGAGGGLAGLMGSVPVKAGLAAAAVAMVTKKVWALKDAAVDAGLGYEQTQAGVRRAAVIFGSSAGIIDGFAGKMASSFGQVKAEVMDAAVSFGGAFKAAGYTSGEAATIGTQLTEMGLNLAAFNAANPDEVFTAMAAALRGEFDPLERFNIALTAAKVEAKALEMGLASSASELTDYSKKQATLALLMEGGKVATGSLQAAQGTLGSELQRLGANWTDLKNVVGSTVAGPLAGALDLFNDLAGAAVALVQPTQQAAAATDAAAEAAERQAAARAARAKADAKAQAEASAKAKKEAEEAAKELADNTESMIGGLQDEYGAALLGGAEYWSLYQLAVSGATQAQVENAAQLMRNKVNLDAEAAAADRAAESLRNLRAWDAEHRGLAVTAEAGSGAAVEALARFRAGGPAVVPQDDPIQRDQLKRLESIDRALNEANAWNRDNGQPGTVVIR